MPEKQHSPIVIIRDSASHPMVPCPRMLAVAYKSSRQPSPQVSEEGHSRSFPEWFQALATGFKPLCRRSRMTFLRHLWQAVVALHQDERAKSDDWLEDPPPWL